MEKRTNFYGLLAFLLLISGTCAAEGVDTNMAQMQAMDKITGRVSIIEIPVGGEAKFGSFSVVIRSCKTSAEEEIPENTAFVDVTDKSFDKEEFNIFKGWMFSSSPAVNAVEHPIYDVWLIKCFNGEPKKERLLSADELSRRDELPRLEDIQEEQKKLTENSFEKANDNILFKDSMYKEEQPIAEPAINAPKIDGEPENLLNIRDSYEEPEEEETIMLPAEDLSQAIKEEMQNLQKQDSSLEKKIEPLPQKGLETPTAQPAAAPADNVEISLNPAPDANTAQTQEDNPEAVQSPNPDDDLTSAIDEELSLHNL